MVIETILTFGLGYLLGQKTGGKGTTPSKIEWPSSEAEAAPAHVPKAPTSPTGTGRPLTKAEKKKVQQAIPGAVMHPDDPAAAAAHDLERAMQ